MKRDKLNSFYINIALVKQTRTQVNTRDLFEGNKPSIHLAIMIFHNMFYMLHYLQFYVKLIGRQSGRNLW